MNQTAATDAASATAEVIISGLGPTGLVLAHMLGMRGHRVVVLEREPVFYGNARAVYTDDECMRIFQHIGVADDVKSSMLFDVPVQFTGPDGGVLGQYLPTRRPNGWPVLVFFYQPYLETKLTELLARYPSVEVLRGRELVAFEQDGQGVTVTHQATQSFRYCDQSDARVARTGDPDPRTLRARYLVGADGGRSRIRELLGIEMTGRSFPEPWLVVDLRQKDRERGLRHMPYFNFVMDPEMPVVSCVQPDGYHRFEFMMMKGQTREWMERPETVRALLAKYVDPDLFEVKRSLVYTFNALVAREWRRQKVLLAGDAAHMTPQFMGQGASAGIRDAYNLGWKLSAVLAGQAGEDLLDSYERERRDHAQSMIDTAVWLKGVVSMTNPVTTRLRNAVLRSSRLIPRLRRWVQEGGFKPAPDLASGRYVGLPRRGRRGPEGALSPQPDVRHIDGRCERLDEVTGRGLALVGYGVDPRASLSPELRQFLDAARARYVTIVRHGQRPQGLAGVARDRPEGLVEVEDLDGRMTRWFDKAGHSPGAVAILRPDKFVFGVVALAELAQAVHELRLQLGA